MEKDKSPNHGGGFLPPLGWHLGFSPPGNSFNTKSEPMASSTLPPLGPGGSSETGHFGHGIPMDSSHFSHDISRMPDNPPKNKGHRRAHSKILTLPDDISFDSDLGVVGGLDGPSLSNETEEDLLFMYLDMDKFNSSSVTSAFQVGEPSSAAAARTPASATSPTENVAPSFSERPRVRHQHSQSMDGSTTIKPEMLMSGSEEASAADSKKSMSAAKLAEVALIDPKRSKRFYKQSYAQFYGLIPHPVALFTLENFSFCIWQSRAVAIGSLRAFIKAHNLHETQIFAKIETVEGLRHFDEILQEADASPPPINPPPKTAPPPPSNPLPKTSPHPPTTEPGAPAPSVDCTTLIYGMSDCLTYLTVGSNETNPEDTCCTGLKTVLDTDANCLCEGLKSSASLGSNIDFKKAKAIPSSPLLPLLLVLLLRLPPINYLIPMQQGHTNEIDTQGQDTDEPVKKSRGGCGAQQPTLTIEGMKMIAEYKLQKKKNDDPEQLPEPVERKQQLSAERLSKTYNASII
ncbi:hypothetical protein HYC85_019030 [Camellia sinensis]|uniref:Bifunctional inhibitor/plant lipid transfer protein/seed storage helical domain-containing protein n=1 Tax=Camellia sinensis TaxID=4442 RepID=A0A7J7GVZ3_CAMSI|nr:hypothetical protein HYC85_019030 [Camellia sinensis]